MFKEWADGLVKRIESLEARNIVPTIFGTRTKIADTPEVIEERTSDELAIVQQFRPQNHGAGVFLFRFLGRGLFFHSLDSQGGTQHVHVPGALFNDGASPHKGYYLGGQLREVVRGNKKELQLVRYIASGALADPRHPSLETDPNVRILEVQTIAVDGVFVLDDSDERRALQ